MIYDNLRIEIFDTVSEFDAITGCGTTAHKLNVEKVHDLKKVCKNPYSLTFRVKMLGLNITLSNINCPKDQKIFAQTIMYKESQTKIIINKS